MSKGQIDPPKPANAPLIISPCEGLRRHPRPVQRPAEDLQPVRGARVIQLPVHRGLCGPREAIHRVDRPLAGL